MNAAALMAIVEPHAEMLKGMGCHVIPAEGDMLEVTTRDSVCPTCTIVIEHVARILADVCMEELERWASDRTYVVNVWHDDLGDDRPWHASTTNRKHPVFSKPTRIAALLALLQWAKSHP